MRDGGRERVKRESGKLIDWVRRWFLTSLALPTNADVRNVHFPSLVFEAFQGSINHLLVPSVARVLTCLVKMAATLDVEAAVGNAIGACFYCNMNSYH